MKSTPLSLAAPGWRAERYINLVRGALVATMTALFFLRFFSSPVYHNQPAFWPHVITLVLGWGYVSLVWWLTRKPKDREVLVWTSAVVDMFLITMNLISDSYSPLGRFPSPEIAFTAGYGLYYISILFSVLRHRPEVSLGVSILAAASYGACTFLFGMVNVPKAYLWVNEGYKILFLLIAGGLTAFSARYIFRALADSQASQVRAAESDERLKELSANLPGALIQLVRTPDGTLTVDYVSDGLLRLLGGRVQAPIKTPEVFAEFLDEATAAELTKLFFQDFTAEATWSTEFPLRIPDQAPRWIKATFSAKARDDGSVVFNGLMLDITQRIETEAQLIEARKVAEDANRAKTFFLANMSHEIRTPLNAIMGLTELLKDSVSGPDQQAHLETILHSGENLLAIINDILDFSKLEAGQLRIQKEYFSIRDLLERLTNLFKKSAQDRGLDFRLIYQEGFPTVVWGDPIRIRQVLVNLIGNALKFTPYGHIHLRGSWKEISGQKIQLSIAVEDSGIGIPKTELIRIFEKFTQVDAAKTRIFGGTGLGLAISRHLTELMDGRLQVRSELGHGSTFTLELESSIQTLDPPSDPKEKETSMKTLPELQVLLVEDNEVNQDVQGRMLKKLGVTVDIASSGHEALKMVQTKVFDIIFMDWQMPVMDGLETTRRIRSEITGGEHLIIIGLSGHALPGDREQLLSSGFNDYLSKPIRLVDFQTVLNRWAPLVGQ